MITLEQYAGRHKDSSDWTAEVKGNAELLLLAVNALEEYMLEDGVVFPVNPKTKSQISGETMGGFRPQWCTQGAAKSNHKRGLAVDRYDPDEHIDEWLMAHQDVLERFGIYIEHPSKTIGWSHWGIKLLPTDAPKSGRHVFYP